MSKQAMASLGDLSESAEHLHPEQTQWNNQAPRLVATVRCAMLQQLVSGRRAAPLQMPVRRAQVAQVAQGCAMQQQPASGSSAALLRGAQAASGAAALL